MASASTLTVTFGAVGCRLVGPLQTTCLDCRWRPLDELLAAAAARLPSGLRRKEMRQSGAYGFPQPGATYQPPENLFNLSEHWSAMGARHGHTKNGTRSAEVNIWFNMRRRCGNPSAANYKYYGGRGITICPRWSGKDGFVNFFADMGPRPSPKHSIDRINNDLGYSPENCRWATQKEQVNNQRHHRKDKKPPKPRVLYTFDGRSQTQAEWMRELGWTKCMFRCRVRKKGLTDISAAVRAAA